MRFLIVIYVVLFSTNVWAGNWNQKSAVDYSGRIPENYKGMPKLQDLRHAYITFYRGDMYHWEHQHLSDASINPTKLLKNLRKDAQVARDLEKTGLISYLLFENGKIVVDEISPKNRLGDLIDENTQLNSASVGKSITSYLLGHAICGGYIPDIEHKLNDWPLLKDTPYFGQPIRNLINMTAGDAGYFRLVDGANNPLIDNKYRVNNPNKQPIRYWAEALRGLNSKFAGTIYNYNAFVANLVYNYLAFKVGNDFQSFTSEIFQKKVGIQQDVFSLKISGYGVTHDSGVLRSSAFFANRYDYLRIAVAILNDWKNDTCVGKYLKSLYKNRVKKPTTGDKPFVFTPPSQSYSGFFHMDFIGVKGKVYGMNGGGGQNVFINFDTGTIVVTHGVHENFNGKTLVLKAVSNK